MGEQVARAAAPELLEFFGKLAGDAKLSILQNVDRRIERLGQAVRRFKKDSCLVARRRGAQFAFASAAFVWQKTAKEKLINRKSRPDQRRQDRGWSRNDRKRQRAFDAFAHETRAGVGKAGRAGVGDEGDLFTSGEPLYQLRRAHRFVVLVITDERLVDLVSLQQNPGMARIFGRDKIDVFQDFEGAQGDVAQISNRRRYHVKHA